MRRRLLQCGRGTAAIEFAVCFPLMLAFMGGIADFGIIYYRKAALSSVITAGAQYALFVDQSGTMPTQTGIQNVLQEAASQMLPNVTVTVQATNPALCYCLTAASPNSTLTQSTCGSNCTSGGTAGKYVEVSATHNYTPLFPALSKISGQPSLTASSWVPLQ
jgi:Flp pilus assembly protein TadG